MKLVEGRKLLKHSNLITIKNYFKKESDNKGICSNDEKI
jgi:collagenase-like PrtC family protease